MSSGNPYYLWGQATPIPYGHRLPLLPNGHRLPLFSMDSGCPYYLWAQAAPITYGLRLPLLPMGSGCPYSLWAQATPIPYGLRLHFCAQPQFARNCAKISTEFLKFCCRCAKNLSARKFSIQFSDFRFCCHISCFWDTPHVTLYLILI